MRMIWRKAWRSIRKVRKRWKKKQISSEFLIGMKQFGDAIAKGNENMCKLLQGRQNKLVKLVKVPCWCKSMKL